MEGADTGNLGKEKEEEDKKDVIRDGITDLPKRITQFRR